MRKRKLKVWNGTLAFSQDAEGRELSGNRCQRDVSLCAYSQKDAIALLEEYGHPMSLYEFRDFWADCWGNSMTGVERERGIWVEYERDKPVRLKAKK